MKKSASQKLREALVDEGVAPHVIHAVLNKLHGVVGVRSSTRPGDDWNALLGGLRYERRMVRSNRQHWPAWLAPLYEEYILVMNRVEERIEQAAFHVLPGQVSPPTLAEYIQHVKGVNRQRGVEGKASLGDRDGRWPSWVPPHVRKDLGRRVEMAYDTRGTRKGRRFTPFNSLKAQQQANLRIQRIEGSIKSMRDTCCTYGKDTASTPFRALHLAAARMAELALFKLCKAYKTGDAHPFDNPIPMHWKQLLDHDMRKALRDAHANPASVTLNGLRSFYEPPRLPTAKPAHAPDDEWLDDTPDADAIALDEQARSAMTDLMVEPKEAHDPTDDIERSPEPRREPETDPYGRRHRAVLGRRHPDDEIIEPAEPALMDHDESEED